MGNVPSVPGFLPPQRTRRAGDPGSGAHLYLHVYPDLTVGARLFRAFGALGCPRGERPVCPRILRKRKAARLRAALLRLRSVGSNE
jgi:hypothetical protein